MIHFQRLSALTCLVCLASCGAVDELQGMLKQQAEIRAELKSRLGVDGQAGWSWTNGRLAQVTVTFDGHAIRDKKISELEAAIRPIVLEHFEEVPETIVISAIFAGIE